MALPFPALVPRAGRRWLGFAAIVVPLTILLALQFRTLSQVQETSAVAHRMMLKGYAKSVLGRVEELYRQQARAALELSPALLEPGQSAALAAHFAAQPGRGVERYFVMPFGAARRPKVTFFPPPGDPADPAAETRAVRVAAAPWRLVAQDGTALESARTVVDEQDRQNRIILRPIVDAASRVLGVAGLIVDTAWVRDRYLPELLAGEMKLFPEALRGEVSVRVREGGDETAPRVATMVGDDLQVPFKFVFGDWWLIIHSPAAGSARSARWSFLTDVALSLLLAAVLLGAVLLALRSAARATKLSQMKTEFVSSVSHELRTPLSSIRVFGEFLRLGRVTEPQQVRAYGEYIESESYRLTQLVNNILDFSKIESGQKRYQFQLADLGAIVRDTLATFAVRLERDGFAVDVRTPPTPLPPAWVDPPAVAQVLTNLLDNAVKYSGEGRRIGIELGQQNGFVTVAVSDQGPGIAPDEHARIFDKFYRVSTGLVHDAKGSGLGLAIVKHIVEAHGGTVAVHSRPGAGSTFVVGLPTHAN